MNSEKNKQTAGLFFSEMGDRWSEALEKIFSDRLTWHIPKGASDAYAGIHQGKANIIGMMCGAADTAFKPGTHASEVLLEVAENNYVIVEAKIKGETMSGQHYNNSYVFIFHFDENGQVCELREHVDTHIARTVFESP